MPISEAQLDHAFAEQIECNPALLKWLLAGGRFARFAESARVLIAEQNAARLAKHWWKHWWCRMPNGEDRETDVFLVCEGAGARFALHIENKPANGILRLEQAAAYRSRAAFKAFDPAWLNYTDFETILMAPKEFIESNLEAAGQLDRCITYEDVAMFVPLFREAVSG